MPWQAEFNNIMFQRLTNHDVASYIQTFLGVKLHKFIKVFTLNAMD